MNAFVLAVMMAFKGKLPKASTRSKTATVPPPPEKPATDNPPIHDIKIAPSAPPAAQDD